MPEPSALPEWDTSQTHVVATTAGHKANGYVSDEIPASDEINYFFNLLYLWTQWFQSLQNATETLIIPTEMGRQISASGFDVLQSGAVGDNWLLTAAKSVIKFPILLPAGRTITDYRVYVRKQSASTEDLTAELRENNAADGVQTTLETVTFSGNNPGYTSFNKGAISRATVAGKSYSLVVLAETGSGSNDFVFHVEVNHRRT